MFWFALTGFLLIWAFLFIRAVACGLVHDEIETKWAYIINWNPLPYLGHVDANNHFTNSLLAGLFYRLFGTDSALIMRLPGLLAFPVYFWSLYRIAGHLKSSLNALSLVAVMGFTVFVVEYFSLSRGYGLSFAFLALALERTMAFQVKGNSGALVVAGLAWVLAIYSNLALLPLAAFGVFHLCTLMWKSVSKRWFIFPLVLLGPLGYLSLYSMHLNELGKLYLGGQSGFIDVTLHSLTRLAWGLNNLWVDVLVGVVFATLFIGLAASVLRHKEVKPVMIVPLYLVVAVVATFLMNWLLGINFPEHRGAVHLALLFLASVIILLDEVKLQLITVALTLGSLVLFGFQATTTYSRNYYFDYFNPEFISQLPEKVNGIPPATYGEYWSMDNELSRSSELPTYAFQQAHQEADTLADFIVARGELPAYLEAMYEIMVPARVDEKVLFKRVRFLERTKVQAYRAELPNNNEFILMYEDTVSVPKYFVVSGHIEQVQLTDKFVLTATATDLNTHEMIHYSEVRLVESCSLNENGSIDFSITLALGKYCDLQLGKVYVWNMNRVPIKGQLETVEYHVTGN